MKPGISSENAWEEVNVKKPKGRQRKLVPAVVLEGLSAGREDDGSDVPQLAARLGRKEWEVEAVLRDMLRKKLVVVMPARSAHEKRRYRAASTWETAAPRHIPAWVMHGYQAQLMALWEISDSIHGRTDPRQLCSSGLREEPAAA